MFRSAGAEWGGKDYDHRNSGRTAGATSGEVTILGRTWKENSRELREWLGISLQETRLSEKLTVRETIELFASFYREPRVAG